MVLSTFRRQAILSLLALFSFFTSYSQTQVTVSGAVSGNGNYATLSAAFTAIGTSQSGANIIIDINADVSEGTSTVAIGAGNWASVLVRPSGGAARTISGATTAGNALVNFNGADNVTFNGLNTGGNSLTISNTTASSSSGTCTILFQTDATSNTITNCTVSGSSTMSTSTSGGTIFFSANASTTGSDNNTISYCNIGPAGSNLPTKAIYGNGTGTTTALGNSGITLDNNNIYDFFNATAASAGIYINGGCNTWSITNNKLYQTATRTWTTGAINSAIFLNSSSSGSGVQAMTITGNTIGYASNTQTGTYTLTGSTGKFQAIYFNGISAGTISNINSNTIASVSLTGVTSSGTSTTASPFYGIVIANGSVNTNSNVIGSQSATGSLTFSTNTTTATTVYGIYNFSVDNWTCNSNQIGGISVTNAGASGTFIIIPLRVNTGTSYTCSATSNLVGGTVANSIQLNSTGAASQVVGLQTDNAALTATSNIIRNLTNNNGTGTSTSASVIGILSTTTSTNHTLSQNTIYNLCNTNTSAATIVTGIQFTGSTVNVVDRNLIYGLTTSTTSTSAEVNGIRVAGGTTTYRNNMIALGAGIANAIGSAASNSGTTGINGFSGFLGTDNFWHNTVYIGGSPTAGSGASYAFNGTQTTNTRSFRNNIFVNARSNSGSASGKNYAVKVNGTTANPTGLTINNNTYYTSGTGGTFGFFNSADVASLGAWQTAVGQDAGSYSTDPLLTDPTNATPDLHVQAGSPADQVGAALGVTDDYDGQTRASFSPNDIGADAFIGTACSGTPTGGTISATSASSCAGATYSMSVSGATSGSGITYQWEVSTTSGSGFGNVSGGSGATTTSYTTGSLTAGGPFYYRLKITCSNSSQTAYSGELALTVNNNPTVSTNPTSTTYCGGSKSLTASGATTYSWSPSTNLSATTGSSVNVTASSASTVTYTVTGTTSGCTATATAVVNPGTVITLTGPTATPSSVCSGFSSALSVSAITTATANQYTFAASSGSFTAISGGTSVATSTSIADFLGDGKTSTTIPLGFTFYFEGVAYTNVIACSDGFLSFNTSATNTLTNNLNTTASTRRPLVAPLWDDLDGASGSGSASYITTGTTGSRVFTIEWLNWQWDYSASGSTISFQVKLYEADGKIEFIYRQESGTVTAGGASIGIAGVTSGKYLSLNGTGTSPSASSSSETTSLSTKPATGQIYAFTPPTLTYAWNESAPSPANLSATNVSSPTAANITATETYTITITESGGCSVTGSATVTLTSGSPTISSFTNTPSGTTCPNVSVTVSPNLSGGCAPYSYLWSTSATTSSISVTPSTTTSYTVTVTDANSQTVSFSGSVSRHVVTAPSISPASPQVCGSGSVTLTASGASSYVWSTSETTAAITKSPTSTITYTVTGTDANTCTATASKTVNVYAGITVSSVTATPSTICSGSNSQLSVSASQPATAAQYTFSASSGTFTPLTGATTVSSIQADDVVSSAIPLGFTFNYGGTNYTNVYVSSNGLISFNSSASTLAANSLSAPGANYLPLIAPLWDDLDGTSTGTASYATTGTSGSKVFTFEWLNWEWLYQANAAVISFQVKLYEADGHIEFVYRQDAGSISTTGLSTPGASIGLATATGIYLSLNGTGTSPIASSSTETTNLLTKPATGQVYSFTPPAATLNYAWSNTGGFITGSTTISNPLAVGVTSTTPYTVTVTNPSTGCSATGSATVTISAASLSVSASATSNPICSGASTTISANITGGCPTYTYAWSNGAGNVGSFSASPTTTTTYTVTVTDNASTTATANVIVTVNTAPTVVITPTPASGNICGSGSVSLAVSGANTYSWSSGSGNPNVVSPTSTTTYTVTGTDGNSCTATANRTVNVYPNPTVIATASPSTICAGSNSQLSATANSTSVSYTMNSNSGVSFVDISTTGTSVGTLSDDGEYNVTIPSFTFGGTAYTSARIGNNGAIAFGTTSGNIAALNATLPSTSNSAGNAFIAPYWSDLYTAGAIYTQAVGSTFIIQWN